VLARPEVHCLLRRDEAHPVESSIEVLPTHGGAKTVGNHIEHIYAKLGVGTRAGAALVAMQQGIVGAHLPGCG